MRRITKEILQTSKGMLEVGVMSQETYEKITIRHLEKNLQFLDPITSEDIKSIREKSCLSQAVFAKHLNVTVGYISQLERGLKVPTGPILVLLNIIRRKGFEVVLR